MSALQSLPPEAVASLAAIDEAIARGTVSYARSATGVIRLLGAPEVNYTPEHLEVFDAVLMRLLRSLEHEDLVLISRQLAQVAHVPPKFGLQLVFDPSPPVAVPLLTGWTGLGDEVLIEIATTRTSQHLEAIARRAQVSEPVTDALVRHGNEAVHVAVAGNPGAAISIQGFGILSDRAGDSLALLLALGTREDTPRRIFVRLVSAADPQIRAKLVAGRSGRSDPSPPVVAEVAKRSAVRKAQFLEMLGEARPEIDALAADARLGAGSVAQYATEGKIGHVIATLARLSDFPAEAIAEAIARDETELVLIVTRSLDLPWSTVREILGLYAGGIGLPRARLDEAVAAFERLKPETARRVVGFHRRYGSGPIVG